MITSAKRQRGLTFISLIMVFIFIGFFAMLVLKIGPIYLDHGKVLNALAAVKESVDLETKSDVEIKEMLRKRFDLNYVSDISMDDINIYKSGYYTKIEIKYEVIKPILGNLSALVEFDDVVEAGQE